MLNSEIVGLSLPRLRRYARALTGSQASGDAYVATTLEALSEDAAVLQEADNPVVALYRAFSKIWNSIDQKMPRGAEGTNATDRHLAKISPLPRQAFLLVALEDFSETEAAAILGVPRTEIAELMKTSGQELAEEIATDVLIIEDEALIAMDLESLVESLGHNVVGVARTHTEAVSKALATRPGLILADIRLADESSGLEAVNELLQTFEVPVIFITAYPEQLLTGLRPEPTFLITKPFRPAMVSAVISQALFFERRAKATPARARAG
ncbi:MAG TPA: response regulator [Bryobacteraceae bacterium]|jgi:CheY-like chemotaxis protein|nr:response regulator [Bryobacteraceae bacterium]